MSYTFLDQQNKLSSLLGDPNTDTDSMFPSAQRLTELNRGEVQMAVDAMDIMELATGTVSGGQISLPSDFVKLYVLILNNVVITNDREVSLKDWERYYNNGDARPYYYIWTISGTTYIKLLSTGSNGQSYSLYYFKKPTTALSSNTDTSLHLEEYREGPVYYAASELMKQIGKATQADQFRQYYESFVQRASDNARKLYIDKEYPRPDFGILGPQSTDTQGGGW